MKLVRLFGPQFLEVFNATMLGWQISGLQWHLRKIEPHPRRLNRVNAGRRLVGGVALGGPAAGPTSVRGGAPEAA